jgi:hypothetical protein
MRTKKKIRARPDQPVITRARPTPTRPKKPGNPTRLTQLTLPVKPAEIQKIKKNHNSNLFL